MSNPSKKFAWTVALCAAAGLFAHATMELFLGGAIPYVVPAILIVAAGYIALIDRTPVPSGSFLKRGVALMFGAFALWLALPQTDTTGIPWQAYAPELLDAARKGNKPVIIDFRASWCGPCKELERNVFSRRKVVEAAAEFLALRADLTGPDEATQKVAQQFEIEGLPTVVFIGADGREKSDLRLVGYERAEDFLQRLQRAR